METYLDEALLCRWVDRGDKVLYLTLKCASDGYADGAEGNTGIVTAEAQGESSGGGFDRERMWIMD